MSDVITFAEIRSRFDGEWVLLEDPETTPSLEIVAGKVLWHSKDREEIYQKAKELQPKESAILYLGHNLKDMEFAL